MFLPVVLKYVWQEGVKQNGRRSNLLYFLQLWIAWPSYINKWLTAERSKFYKPIQQVQTVSVKIDGFFKGCYIISGSIAGRYFSWCFKLRYVHFVLMSNVHRRVFKNYQLNIKFNGSCTVFSRSLKPPRPQLPVIPVIKWGRSQCYRVSSPLPWII